jgi:toxin ParE1/3/4
VKVEWLDSAEADLGSLLLYIARENPPAAYAMHDRITSRVEQLRTYPRIGRPGRVRGTPELVVTGTPYLVAYRVQRSAVFILRVLHGARRWPRRF